MCLFNLRVLSLCLSILPSCFVILLFLRSSFFFLLSTFIFLLSSFFFLLSLSSVFFPFCSFFFLIPVSSFCFISSCLFLLASFVLLCVSCRARGHIHMYKYVASATGTLTKHCPHCTRRLRAVGRKSPPKAAADVVLLVVRHLKVREAYKGGGSSGC